MKTLTVELGDRSYPIYIESGLFEHAADFIQKHQPHQNIFIITDANVAPLYLQSLKEQLQRADFQVASCVVPAGEPSKSLYQANALYTWMLENHATRQSAIIALGGGIVGDLSGFVAATFMRGIPFIQIPTTLLSQVDSSVGGKVGINHALGKNLIGAFYQPQAVIMDPQMLHTLPEREIVAGMAEVIKYGFITDADFYDFVEDHLESLIELRESEQIEHVLYKSCAIKADVVSRDEREDGLRAILNFGHTIGHALEAVTAYTHFLHGEAIIYGMMAALQLSVRTGHLSAEIAHQAQKTLELFSFPPIPSGITTEDILTATRKDKKRTDKGQLWILLDDIGSAVRTREVEEKMVGGVIEGMVAKTKSQVI